MSGRDPLCSPRRFGRGAALTLVFAGVLVAGAATGSLPGDGGRAAADAARSAGPASPVSPPEAVTRAAEEAMADGKSPLEAAERAVSRSGDRWAAVY
ncbi:peptidase S41, partial [Streptomyces sp. NPDC057052]